MKRTRKKYLMGVDVGTQAAKVTIFDLNGRIVCEGRQALRKIEIPAPLLAEHPDDDLWEALKIAFRRVMAHFYEGHGRKAEDILAMGVCIIRCCRVLLKANGRLAHPVISWMDKRLNRPYEHLQQYGDVRYVTTASGYITHRLTGTRRDTCANYIGWWPMDIDTCNWSRDDALFEACRLKHEMLLDVVSPGEILGRVTAQAATATGIPDGLPVVATAHDKAVEALGAGSLGPESALISLGTYIGAMVHGRENVGNAQHFWTFPASIPGRYLYECMGVRRGMWTVSWFCEQFGAGIIDEARAKGLSVEAFFDQEAATVPAGCDGLVTIHDWAPPTEATFRKGGMLGFDGRHGRAHIYRSILEGIALTMKNHMDKMADELGRPIKRLIISGGGANSDIFMQIFADVFGIATRRNRIMGSAALGCAINAGMAMGVFETYDDAIQNMVRPGDEFRPDLENTRFYHALNDTVYRRAHQHLDPLLKDLSRLVD